MAVKNVKRKPKSKVVSRSIANRSISIKKRWAVLAIALFAGVGSYFIYQSFANPLFSTNAKDVVLEYIPPHNHIDTEGKLSDAHYSPFTLYGDGLLVCGRTHEDQFRAPNLPAEGEAHDHVPQAPTARVLSGSDVSRLVQSVKETGFQQLDDEYFDLPVAQQRYMIRLVSKKTQKVVQYYNDVEPPAAYLNTLSIMKSACDMTTQPYVSEQAVVRSRAAVDTANTNVEDLLQSIELPTANKLRESLNKSKSLKRQNDEKRATGQQVEENEETTAVITGSEAKKAQRAMNGKKSKVVREGDTTYELAVDPELPKPNNPLEIDFNTVRDKTEQKRQDGKRSNVDRLLDVVDPSGIAHAQTTQKGYRIVLLLPSSGGSTAKDDDAKNKAAHMRQWLYSEVRQYPTSKGFSVIRGSQTQAYYNACHSSYCNGNQLYNILVNVRNKDVGTIYRPDVATIVIPGWKTNTLGTSGTKACGWGMSPGALSAIDLYQTSSINGLVCKLSKTFPHEYVHNVGLGHVTECTARNLMDGPPGCRYSNGCNIVGTSDPRCVLWDGQVTKLKASGKY